MFSGHDLNKLAAFDLSKVPDMETLSSDMIKKMHHTMMEHFGHEDFGSSLPETQIQAMIVGVSTFPLYPNHFIFFSCCGMECSNECSNGVFNLRCNHVITLFLCLCFPNILNSGLFYL